MTDLSPPADPAARVGRRHGLGRGLDALLGGQTAPGETASDRILAVDPARIEPNPEQPRRTFDDADLRDLAESLRAHGLLQPIVVEPHGSGYRLVAGERRLRAARLAGLSTIPAIVRPPTESARHALELALVENLQRADLAPLEEAAAYARLADTFGLAHEAIALRVGRSRPAVTNAMRLLGLPADIQAALNQRRITAGHARALLALPDPAAQLALLQRIEDEHLSVRHVEDAVRAVHSAPTPVTPSSASVAGRPTEPTPLSADDAALQRGLEDALGTPVRLERRRRGGRILIEFFSDEELDALYRRLGGTSL